MLGDDQQVVGEVRDAILKVAGLLVGAAFHQDLELPGGFLDSQQIEQWNLIATAHGVSVSWLKAACASLMGHMRLPRSRSLK